MSIADQS